MLVIQIGMGIQIRESVDWAFKIDELFDRENLIDIVPWIFYVHRSFSWVLLVFAVLALSYIVKSKSIRDKLREISTWKFLFSDVKVRWGLIYNFSSRQMLIGGALTIWVFPCCTAITPLSSKSNVWSALFFILLRVRIVNYEKSNITVESNANLANNLLEKEKI